MVGPNNMALIAAIYLATTPPLTNTEVIEALNECKAETVTTVKNSKDEIVLVYCND